MLGEGQVMELVLGGLIAALRRLLASVLATLRRSTLALITTTAEISMYRKSPRLFS
jgi:uncharacterized membrane protein YccF (DUF307 family)